MYKIKGFTLAEVLITILVIGIVIGLSASIITKSHDEADLTKKDSDSQKKQVEFVNTYENRIRSGIDDIALSNLDFQTDAMGNRTFTIRRYVPHCSKVGGAVNPVMNILYYKYNYTMGTDAGVTYVASLAIYDENTCTPDPLGTDKCNYYLYYITASTDYDLVRNNFQGLINDARTIYPQILLAEGNLPPEIDFQEDPTPVVLPLGADLQNLTPDMSCGTLGNKKIVKFNEIPSSQTCGLDRLKLPDPNMVRNIPLGSDLYICREEAIDKVLDIANFNGNYQYMLRAYDETWMRQMIDRKIDRGSNLADEECSFVISYNYRMKEINNANLCPVTVVAPPAAAAPYNGPQDNAPLLEDHDDDSNKPYKDYKENN